ncbi:hypothetical protein, partial [Streptacidiphilus jiangxiensis]
MDVAGASMATPSQPAPGTPALLPAPHRATRRYASSSFLRTLEPSVSSPDPQSPRSSAAPGQQTATPLPDTSGAPGAARGGAAAGLVLPPPDDALWAAIPQKLASALIMPAHDLVSPPRGALAAEGGRELQQALRRATTPGALLGEHWRTLLTSPRTAFGGTRSARAQDLYEALERVVDQYLRPALDQPATPAPAAAAEAAAPALPDTATDAPPPEPRSEATGAAAGLVLPAPTDPLWKEIPLGLRNQLTRPAYALVHPARGSLATKPGRPLRQALSAAASRRTTGAHWHTLLTAPRSAFGGSGSERAQRAYELLEQVVAQWLLPALEQQPVTADTPLPPQTNAPADEQSPGTVPAARTQAELPSPAEPVPATAPLPDLGPDSGTATADRSSSAIEADTLADALLDAANAGAIVCVTGPAEAAAPAIDAAC